MLSNGEQYVMVTDTVGHIEEIRTGLVKTNPIAGMSPGETVLLGEDHIKGEILQNNMHHAIILPLDDIKGLKPGIPITKSAQESSYSIELGPGFIGKTLLYNQASLDREKKWAFKPTISLHSHICSGFILGTIAARTKSIA